MDDIQKQAKIAELQARVEVEKVYAMRREAINLGMEYRQFEECAKAITGYANKLRQIAGASETAG